MRMVVRKQIILLTHSVFTEPQKETCLVKIKHLVYYQKSDYRQVWSKVL